MKCEMEKVIIYTPTFRNEKIFDAVLSSYLRQTYENIEIHIFDNSLADGYDDVFRLINEKNDKRIKYFYNQSQIGAHGNYHRIIDNINPDNLSIVLASDMGLHDCAIENLVNFKNMENVGIVMPASRNYSAELLKNNSNIFDFSVQSFMALEKLSIENRLFSAGEVIMKYYEYENISGEFFKFSFLGALFDGELARKLPQGWRRFKYHGLEQYLSIALLLRSDKLFYLADELLFNFIGHKRLGGTERSSTDIGRIECIEACQMIIEENDFFMFGSGFDVNKMRRSQINKAEYFLNHYNGFEGYPDRIISKNMKFLGGIA